MEKIDYHAEIEILGKHTRYASDVVAMVDDHERVILALQRLAKLQRPLLVRWSDPNYG